MADFTQRILPGGHELHGEADLADGHATFLLMFAHIEDEFEGAVGSELTSMSVTLNDCLIKDPDFARRLFAEATMRDQP